MCNSQRIAELKNCPLKLALQVALSEVHLLCIKAQAVVFNRFLSETLSISRGLGILMISLREKCK